MLASCWVARKIFLSPASASSSARTLDSRPTTNGVIMYGKMTTSRMGIMGSFLVSNFSRWVTETALSFRAANRSEEIELRSMRHLAPDRHCSTGVIQLWTPCE